MILLVFCLIVSSNALTDFNKIVNYFSIELMYFTNQEINNTLISPFGVWSVLTGYSVTNTGVARNQLLNVLRLPDNDIEIMDGYKNVKRAIQNNTMFTSKQYLYYHMNVTLSKKFDNLTDNFDITQVKLNFSEPETASLVANILASDAGIEADNLLTDADFMDSNAIFASVIKFRGILLSPFSKERTSKQQFYMNPNDVKDVNMMHQTGQFFYSNIDKIQSEVLELPYRNNVSMILILPNENVALDKVYEGFSQLSLKGMLRKLERNDISISVPRFKISSNLILNKPLSDMGLNIYDTFHKSKLVNKVDLEFIETGVYTREHVVPVKVFNANRPFIYLILDKTTSTCIISGFFAKAILY